MASTSVLAEIRPSKSLHFCNGCTEMHICDYVPCPGARSNMISAVAAVVEGRRSVRLRLSSSVFK